MRKVAGWLFSSLDCVVEAPNEWQFDFDGLPPLNPSRIFALEFGAYLHFSIIDPLQLSVKIFNLKSPKRAGRSQGRNTVDPVVRRPSRSRWARAASARG